MPLTERKENHNAEKSHAHNYVDDVQRDPQNHELVQEKIKRKDKKSMDRLIFNVLMALVVALAGIVARKLLPYIEKKVEEAEEKIRRTQWAWAVDIVEAVVRAVEQTVAEDIHGKDKKDRAILYITRLLRENGISLSAEEISTLIEAAVHTMNENCILAGAGELVDLPDGELIETE